MASRRDELRAHQFLKQRAVSALVVHETDPEQPPFRRPTFSAFWGVVLALVGLAIAAVVGLFNNDGTVKIEAGKTVIVENGTGARFVLLSGRLHPVTNYTSALLALGSKAPTQTVDPGDLVGRKRGAVLGITGAPDELPARSRLLTGAWTMCSRPSTAGNGTRRDTSTLLVGESPGGASAAGDRAVVVSSGKDEYLLWHGRRHRFTDVRAVSIALGLASRPAIPVSSAWLDVVPAGSDLGPVTVTGLGRPARTMQGTRPGTLAGQLFYVPTGEADRQYYLALGDRLQPITPLQAQIQFAASSTARAYTGTPRLIRLDPAQVNVANASQDSPSATNGDLPTTRPALLAPAADTAPVCARFSGGRSLPTLSVGARLPAASRGQAIGGVRRSGTVLADRVFVPEGRAAYVQVVGTDKAGAGTLALVTDNGRLYPFASKDVAKILGYDKDRPVRIAATLAARLPHGPSLDPAAARKPA